eukprot:GHVU01007963.1.p1 GENE.GHVU01007963.1~~GHVU01007963.1.p1  ORF type:complete len:157 (+),score=11.26 GHVU01007963.1:104-574(+)
MDAMMKHISIEIDTSSRSSRSVVSVSADRPAAAIFASCCCLVPPLDPYSIPYSTSLSLSLIYSPLVDTVKIRLKHEKRIIYERWTTMDIAATRAPPFAEARVRTLLLRYPSIDTSSRRRLTYHLMHPAKKVTCPSSRDSLHGSLRGSVLSSPASSS